MNIFIGKAVDVTVYSECFVLGYHSQPDYLVKNYLIFIVYQCYCVNERWQDISIFCYLEFHIAFNAAIDKFKKNHLRFSIQLCYDTRVTAFDQGLKDWIQAVRILKL